MLMFELAPLFLYLILYLHCNTSLDLPWLWVKCVLLLWLCVCAQLKWTAPDEEGLVNFLVETKGFKYVNHILCHL